MINHAYADLPSAPQLGSTWHDRRPGGPRPIRDLARRGLASAHGRFQGELLDCLLQLETALSEDSSELAAKFPQHASQFAALDARRRSLCNDVRRWIRLLESINAPGSILGVRALLDGILELDSRETALLIEAYWVDLGQPG